MELKSLFYIAFCSFITINVFSAEVTVPTDVPTAIPPTETPTPMPVKKPAGPNTAKALIVHKPKPSPSWGKVIQYHREVILALTESNRETLHEFVFQDDEGIIRTAIFHEDASGDGYWEVWVWDQQ